MLAQIFFEDDGEESDGEAAGSREAWLAKLDSRAASLSQQVRCFAPTVCVEQSYVLHQAALNTNCNVMPLFLLYSVLAVVLLSCLSNIALAGGRPGEGAASSGGALERT